MIKQDKIRNFSIIAHIDHGKSTLADRILEFTGSISQREMRSQVLDTMDLERERGITIKAQSARISYKASDGETYLLNLIDTPGHVDFTFEVNRSLAACEGVLLVVDASQGVEAQTVANLYKAIEMDLVIIPVVNKIDLPGANVDNTIEQIHDILGSDPDEILLTSAKQGTGIKEILEDVVKKIPPPSGSLSEPLRALAIDSVYNTFRGVVAYIRVVDGKIKQGDRIVLMRGQEEYEVGEIGIFTPKPVVCKSLQAGEVGYLIANIKDIDDLEVGETLTSADNPAKKPLPGYHPVKPMVFCGLYPAETEGFEPLREALNKLHLNDSSFQFDPETSAALGFGFRCGFLGLLHMEIIQERLEREYDLVLVTTAPNVIYELKLTSGDIIYIDNPTKLPNLTEIDEIREPFINATIITTSDTVGSIMKLCMDRRAVDKGMEYLPGNRVMMYYSLPLNEVISDFYDRLKSVSSGYASFDYEISGYQSGPLVKVDILLNGEPVDALSFITHKSRAEYKGRNLAEKLRKVVPRQMYDVAIQAAIGNKIIARETVKALRKNVTAKCYGGDITRKRKLLEKQKEGKRRMKKVGNVTLPQEAFRVVLDV